MNNSIRFEHIIKSILFNIYFYFLTIVLVLVCFPLLLFSYKGMRIVSKLWGMILKSGMKICLRLDINIIGKLNTKKQVIYAVKHHSAWETVFCTDFFKMPAIVLKKELIFLPIIGLYFLIGGSIAISRENTLASLKKISVKAKKASEKGRSIMIFPQGTRVPIDANTKKYPYLPGVYFMYKQSNLPIVPVAHNAGMFWPKNSFLKYTNNLKSNSVSIEILDEIPVGLSKNDFMQILESKIENATKKLIEKER